MFQEIFEKDVSHCFTEVKELELTPKYDRIVELSSLLIYTEELGLTDQI